MKINGTIVPTWSIGFLVAGLIAAGALQTQVHLNAAELERRTAQVNKVAVLEVTQKDIKDDIDRIEKHAAAQTVLLNQIYVELARQGQE